MLYFEIIGVQTESECKFPMSLLRPVVQLYGQVRMLCNQRFVIDCSLSHPAGHKSFTYSHCVYMYHVT